MKPSSKKGGMIESTVPNPIELYQRKPPEKLKRFLYVRTEKEGKREKEEEGKREKEEETGDFFRTERELPILEKGDIIAMVTYDENSIFTVEGIYGKDIVIQQEFISEEKYFDLVIENGEYQIAQQKDGRGDRIPHFINTYIGQKLKDVRKLYGI